MGYGINTGYDISLVAAADLSADQFCFVAVNSSGEAALAGAGAAALGVLQGAPTAGEAAQIRVMGVSKVVAGGTITAGNLISSNASGQAVAYTALAVTTTITNGTPDTAANTYAGSQVLGIALDSAGASGEIITVALIHSGLSA